MFFIKFIAAVLLIFAVLQYGRLQRKRKRLTDAISKLPGPPEPRVPLLANMVNILLYEFVVAGQFDTYVLLYHEMLSNCRVFLKEGLHRFWISWIPVVVLYSPETIEPVLNSNTILTKADLYKVIEPWVGQGLLTSGGNKWRSRRKIITPAFHFSILTDFLPVMNRSATTLIRKFNNIKYTCLFDLNPPISLCTLDTISNTAMGIDLECQANEHSDYVKAIDEVQRLALLRVARAWLWSDWIFYRTASGRKFTKVRNLMHDFTEKVILERKVEWEELLRSQGVESFRDHRGVDGRKVTFDEVLASSSFKNSRLRLAFLDLLLHQHLVEKNLTIEDINEEVSTFMFAGYDTTASNITWTLYHLGLYKEIQNKVRAEMDEIFGDTSNEEQEFELDGSRVARKLVTTEVTNEHLSRMKYLEMVIKETLRLTPTAPFMARNISEDIVVGGQHLVPAGSMCMIFAHALHLNPHVYENPQKFDPDRFSSENCLKRHPFAHLPFSAGPRNCIGQRFAMMEAKVILAKILRNYVIESDKPMDKIRFVGEMILKSDVGLHVRLTPRFA